MTGLILPSALAGPWLLYSYTLRRTHFRYTGSDTLYNTIARGQSNFASVRAVTLCSTLPDVRGMGTDHLADIARECICRFASRHEHCEFPGVLWNVLLEAELSKVLADRVGTTRAFTAVRPPRPRWQPSAMAWIVSSTRVVRDSVTLQAELPVWCRIPEYCAMWTNEFIGKLSSERSRWCS